MIEYKDLTGAVGCNWYEVDPNLQFLMDRLLEQGDREFAETWLKRWGALCGGPIAERAERTDRHPPILERYDRWGEEIDRVEHDPAAIATKRDLWNAGFNGLPYSEVAKERGRPVPAPLMTAFSYLLAQAETGMLCAVGMTPAVAHLIERHGSEELKARFLPHLRAMNFEDAWDGSMFLTEKTGGSDLGTVSTVARPNGDHWLLEGTKWFCSNVDGMVIATLARPEGGKPGIKGVAAFIVPRFRSDGTRNGLRIRRIKEKLGTRAVPTAEVDFVDAEAYLLGDDPFDGKGINRAMEMVNISRAGVGVMGAGIARRSFLEAAIFAANREAFGRTLTDWPILRKDLLAIQLASESAAALIFEVARLTHLHDHLGDEEAGRLLRILTPLVKLRATRQGLTAASAALEVLGGNGYIENWPMARQLRDAQCHTIWEGTDNIMVLDIFRAMAKENAHTALFARMEQAIEATSHPVLRKTWRTVQQAFHEFREVFTELSRRAPQELAGKQKVVANDLADLLQAALLLEEATFELTRKNSARKGALAAIFVQSRLEPRSYRNLLDSDALPLELFDPIFRYGPIDPERLKTYL